MTPVSTTAGTDGSAKLLEKGTLSAKSRIQMGPHRQGWKEVVWLSFLGDQKTGSSGGRTAGTLLSLGTTSGERKVSGSFSELPVGAVQSILVNAILVANNRNSNRLKQRGDVYGEEKTAPACPDSSALLAL